MVNTKAAIFLSLLATPNLAFAAWSGSSGGWEIWDSPNGAVLNAPFDEGRVLREKDLDPAFERVARRTGSRPVTLSGPNGMWREEAVFWADNKYPNSANDFKYRHQHGHLHTSLAVDENGHTWTLTDDNAFIYSASDLVLRVEHRTDIAARGDDHAASPYEKASNIAYANAFVFRNARGYPVKNPFNNQYGTAGSLGDERDFVRNDSAFCDGVSRYTGSDVHGQPFPGYPKVGQVNGDSDPHGLPEGCVPPHIRQTRGGDMIFHNGSFYIAFTERYFERPGSAELQNDSANWDEFKVYVAKYTPWEDFPYEQEILEYLEGTLPHGGALNKYSGKKDAFSPRLAMVDGDLWVTWVEEDGSYRDVHAAKYDFAVGDWIRAGGTWGIGANHACQMTIHPSDATAGRGWNSASSNDVTDAVKNHKPWPGVPASVSATVDGFGYERMSSEGYAVDIAGGIVDGETVPILAISDELNGTCRVLAKAYRPAQNDFNGLGTGMLLLDTDTTMGDVGRITPRIAAIGDQAWVTFVDRDADGYEDTRGRVFVSQIDLENETSELLKRQSNYSLQWETRAAFPSIAVQADYKPIGSCMNCAYNPRDGTRISVMNLYHGDFDMTTFQRPSDARRRDCYIDADTTAAVCDDYKYFPYGAVNEDGARYEVTRNVVHAPTDVVITTKQESTIAHPMFPVSYNRDWNTTAAHVVKQNGHRVKDTSSIVRRGFYDVP